MGLNTARYREQGNRECLLTYTDCSLLGLDAVVMRERIKYRDREKQ